MDDVREREVRKSSVWRAVLCGDAFGNWIARELLEGGGLDAAK